MPDSKISVAHKFHVANRNFVNVNKLKRSLRFPLSFHLFPISCSASALHFWAQFSYRFLFCFGQLFCCIFFIFFLYFFLLSFLFFALFGFHFDWVSSAFSLAWNVRGNYLSRCHTWWTSTEFVACGCDFRFCIKFHQHNTQNAAKHSRKKSRRQQQNQQGWISWEVLSIGLSLGVDNSTTTF